MSDQEPQTVFAIPIDWQDVVNSQTVFANQVLLQADEHDFYLCFCDVPPPIIIGETDEERLASLKNTQTVKARIVARIGINAERMPGLLTAIHDAVGKYMMGKAARQLAAKPTAEANSEETDTSSARPKAAG